MRAVLQRVSSASVEVDKQVVGRIRKGLLVYLSVGKGDSDTDAEFIAEKLASWNPKDSRDFCPGNLKEISQGQSADICGRSGKDEPQYFGSRRRNTYSEQFHSSWRLPQETQMVAATSFDAADEPQNANRLYEKTIQLVTESGVKTEKGIFGACMQVASVNPEKSERFPGLCPGNSKGISQGDGPVTFLLDSTRVS